MSRTPKLTDRKALETHRARAARAPVTFLHEVVAEALTERLGEVNKTFKKPLLVGHITPPFVQAFPDAPRIDDAPELVITKAAQDLVLHLFGLHWADDPVGQMVQSRLALAPDGLFIGVMFGGATLNELRSAMAEAEAKLTGGLSPRILPMGDLRDLGGLLQRAGFALPVADSETYRVRYPNLAKLTTDLRGMGETNALADRLRTPANRAFFAETETIYRQNFSDEGYLLASFEVIFLTGWAPSADQPQPLRPGSATTRLAEALGVPETKLDDPPG
ncbi:MAG: SAM-dependent methyltransferase [Silicimonas sp.]|nr:SAM-dependent methyltransferase [Silicimonas sp.]